MTSNVKQWDRFEVVVENDRHYRDPYRDVELEMTVTKPNGEVSRFWGFHDGGSTWRFRYMPDQPGTWSYRGGFSDGGGHVSGELECVESDVPGVIGAYGKNPVWFGYRGGGATLLRSLHVGDRFFAANWPDSERARFLDWAGSQGYDTLSIASFLLNRNSEGRGAGWETPALWPLDPAEFRRLETMLDDLADRRFVVFPFAGFFGRNADFPRARGDQELFIRYVLARLGPYWNMLFNVAGPEPLLRADDFAGIMLWHDLERIAKMIRRLDPFGHLITVHNRTGDDLFRDEDWIDFGTIQGPKTTDPVKLGVRHALNHHRSKPMYSQETLWSGNKLHPDYSDENVRKNACVMLMSAAAINFADNGPPAGEGKGLSSDGFSGTLALEDRHQDRHDIVRRVWDFFETAAYWELTPRPDLVSHGWCLADAGRRYLVYIANPLPVDVLVETAGEREYSCTWIDASDTTRRTDGGTTRDGRNLTPPAGADDSFLELVASDSAPASV
jgi:hypothetical protein